MAVLGAVDNRTGTFDAFSVEAFVQALPQPTIVVGSDLRVLAANAPARDIVPALRVGDLLALSLRDPNVLDAVRAVDATGTPLTVIWRDRVPVERIYQVSATRYAPTQKTRAIILTLEDLTEARRVEQMRADFIANASHELRTPLASLLGFVETLQGPARDDPQARGRFLTIMAEQAKRMARLVDDLLSLSRIEQKRHIKPSQPVNLSNVVRHVADTLASLAHENGMAFRFDVADDVIVTGDQDELVRVAENLIENAIKYGRRSGHREGADTIDLTVSARRSTGVLSVRDRGDGIAPEHLPRLTERFYRIDASQSRAKGGTGLGLALVKHIVAHHRGRLDIDSTLGEGSSFTVLLPLHCDFR
jgi:two-component system, OmpR family, phosphate regulon sensor histidine kinase PhoR